MHYPRRPYGAIGNASCAVSNGQALVLRARTRARCIGAAMARQTAACLGAIGRGLPSGARHPGFAHVGRIHPDESANAVPSWTSAVYFPLLRGSAPEVVGRCADGLSHLRRGRPSERRSEPSWHRLRCGQNGIEFFLHGFEHGGVVLKQTNSNDAFDLLDLDFDARLSVKRATDVAP